MFDVQPRNLFPAPSDHEVVFIDSVVGVQRGSDEVAGVGLVAVVLLVVDAANGGRADVRANSGNTVGAVA